MEQSIELDCAPGSLRPGDLIAGVIKGTGLKEQEPVSTVFGNWTWIYPDVPESQWKVIQKVLKDRIEKLYHSGAIRYGSW